MSIEESNIHEKPQKRRNLADKFPFLPALLASLLRLLLGTCRFTFLGLEHFERLRDQEGPIIAAFWHFSFPAVLYHFRDNNLLSIISKSRDGWIAAGMAENLGYRPFRGSPGKGGALAIRQFISAIRSCHGGGFPVDGSQGPAQIAQKGVVHLAQYSGAPMLPVSMAANPCWRLRSWDRTVIPKPFSRVVMTFGPPIRVERRATAEGIEKTRLELERVLNALSEEAHGAAFGSGCTKR